MSERTTGMRQFRQEMAALTASAEVAARQAGSAQVEAEHLLLAIATAGFGVAAAVLDALGLTPDRIASALARERASALALAGVDTSGLPPARPRLFAKHLRWGRSAMLAVERSCEERPTDPTLRVLLGIVHAEAGIVPRLLAELNLTVAAVEEAVRVAT